MVVEGYMDVIACQRAGVAGVAGMGTALTEEQMALMWRFHPEPTLCFDGDAAGQRAVARAIERALPQLKPGKSFRFAIGSGGKDPDDVLREQGPVALKAQLADTTAFSAALFAKPQEGGDRPFPQQRRPAASGRWRGQGDRFPDRSPPTPEGKAAARRLAEGLDPLAAAVAKGALEDPVRLDDRLEAMERHGLGHPALNDLASEIIRLRLEADVLDSEGLTRHLTTRGFGALLGEIDRAARISGAPFLNPDIPQDAARISWSHAFEVLTRMAALESALSAAKSELTESSDAQAFMRLKGERDALKRAIRTGTVWTATGSID